MIHLDANCLMESQLARSIGLDKYADIMEAARKKNVSSDALRRFFRDHFNYGRDERLVIYPDSWANGFYFQCDRLTGGIVRHEDVVKGRNGREYKKVYYAMHT